MRMLTCECCGRAHPMGETLDIQGRTLCIACGEEFLRDHALPGDAPAMRNVDPTVCVNCGADNGDTPHGLLMQQPACATCVDFFRNRPFPKWIRVAFAAVLVLVVVSLAWNWRFFQGHFEIKAAFAAMGKADVKEAAQQMAAAAEHVPESLELQELAAFFRGVACLNEDKSEEAQQCFSRCPHLPPEYGASQLLQQATAGAAFDRKDYDRFLEVAEEMARQQPQDPVARAQVASALACQYALRGEEELRRRAEAKLEEAKALGNAPIQATRYEERIRHRLQTREIIDSQEFLRRFPHGWPPSGEPKS